MPADAATDGPVPGGQVEIRSDAEDAGQRLDRVLQRHLPELSRTRFKQLILAGDVTSDGAVQRDPAQRVQPGQNFWSSCRNRPTRSRRRRRSRSRSALRMST